MTPVIKIAKQISENLKTIEVNGGGTRIVWKDEAPEELRQWFSDISGEYTGNNFTQLDEVYRVLDTLCDIINDQMDENSTPDDLEEAISQYEYASVYNADLLAWLTEDMGREDDVNEMLKEGAEGVFEAIRMAIDRTRADMALSFAGKLVDRAA